MRESHPNVQDLQSTTRLAESWMLQILGHKNGIPSSLLQCGDGLFFSFLSKNLQNRYKMHTRRDFS